MPVHVNGANAAEAARVRAWCEEALDRLGERSADLPVEVWGFAFTPAPEGREGEAGDLGMALHRSLLAGPDQRLGWVIFEEVAHVLLHRAGVPSEGHGGFFQELFATWLQYETFFASGRADPTKLRTWPVDPSPEWLPYTLGKHLGAALAGSDVNRGHLDAWLNSDAADSEWVEVVRGAERSLTPPLTIASVAAAYRSAE